MEDASAYLVVVRRGDADTYARLTTQSWGVTVIWDRRYAERRRAKTLNPPGRNRRRRDRRRAAPGTWTTLGVLMVRQLDAS